MSIGIEDISITYGAAGQEVRTVPAWAQFVRIRGATGSVFLKAGGGKELSRERGEELNLGPGRDRAIELIVRSAIAQTVTLCFSKYSQSDDRSTGGETVDVLPADGGNDYADQAITTATTTQVLAANTSRKAAYVQNLDGATDIRVGFSNNVGASRGFVLGPGMEMTFNEYQGAIYVYHAKGSNLNVAALETTKS